MASAARSQPLPLAPQLDPQPNGDLAETLAELYLMGLIEENVGADGVPRFSPVAEQHREWKKAANTQHAERLA